MLISLTQFAKMKELHVIYVVLASLLDLINMFRFLTIFFSLFLNRLLKFIATEVLAAL